MRPFESSYGSVSSGSGGGTPILAGTAAVSHAGVGNLTSTAFIATPHTHTYVLVLVISSSVGADDDRASCSDSTLDLRESPDAVRAAVESPGLLLRLLVLRWVAEESLLANFADSSFARADNDDVAAGAPTFLPAGVGLPGGGTDRHLGDAPDGEDRVCRICLARAARRFAFATRSTPPRTAARRGTLC